MSATSAMAATMAMTAGCASIPTSLQPQLTGSIGMPHRGVLKYGTTLPVSGEGFRFLRNNARRSALPRFAAALSRSAKLLADARRGAPLVLGDLSSARGGGPLLPHFSHRSGVDADLLLMLTTPDGVPVASPGFLSIGADGLAQDPEHGMRLYRFDVERQWLLVRAMLTDPDARVQWIFVQDNLRAMLLQWAAARGESLTLLRHAAEVMAQPNPGGEHDDHLHVRTACDAAEVTLGCQPFGPRRAWLAEERAAPKDTDLELAVALMATTERGAESDGR